MIRVLIAASSAVLRAGLEALVASSPGLELAGSFADLASVEDLRPDVVLTTLPLEDLTAAPDGRPPAAVLIRDDPPPWTQDAVRLGVRAVLGRDASPAQILAAVEAAARGLAVLDPRELEAILSPSERARTQADGGPLTPRELEVLRMLAEGAANKTIAWKLDLSEHTVKFHVASVMAKLGAASRTEAVTTGIRRGFILI